MFAIQRKFDKNFFTNGDMTNPSSAQNWSDNQFWAFRNATHALNVLRNHDSFWVDPGVDRWHYNAALDDSYEIVRMDGKTFNFMAS